MNRNNYNLELLTEQIAMVLEALEEYIRHAEYDSDWASKEQFYSRTASVYKISLEVAEGGFFSQFSVASTTFFSVEKYRNDCQETQKEFYKWVDHSGITAENCPEKSKHYLNEINEALENGDSKLYQAYQAAIEEESSKTKLLEKSPFFYRACKEVDKELGYAGFGELPISKAKNYELKIKGNAERGRQTFQQIKNSIVSRPEWTFPISGENYIRKVEEKIKELEAKKDQPQPKEEWKREANLEGFDECLMILEIYIQKLNYYPDWKIRVWTEKGREDWRKDWKWENKTAEEIKDHVLAYLKGTPLMLKQFKADDPHYYPYLVDELKIKFSQWQSEREINANNCPEQLKQVLSTINEILENNGNYWRGWKKNEDNERKNNEDKEKEIIEIIVKLKLEIAELTKKYKITDLVPNNWQDELISMKSLAEAKAYQQQIEQKIQAEKAKRQTTTAADENKLSLPTKLVIGAGIIGLVLGTIIVVRWVIKNQKVKK